jgi:omega-6 fatty acid desaturase (delta-12 desaturase)
MPNQNEPSQMNLPTIAEINRALAPYQKAKNSTAVWQLLNSLVPYLLLWVGMALAIRVSYALTFGLAVIASGFLVRLFIIFHDCGHNSFFPSTRWNKAVGFWLGVLVFTPGEQWWHAHAIHHATSGNLDKRGTGDVLTMTVAEYRASSPLARIGYRLFRTPLVMFGLGPIYMFLILHRLTRPVFGKKETLSVILTNLAILALAVAISLLIGWQAYLLIQLPVILMGGAAGIWMFYVQHQYGDVYWERTKEWNYMASAMLGASYYRLPALLQWFSGNIGFHHLHHLSPRIPNYLLPNAHREVDLFRKWTRVIGVRESLSLTRLKLWSESEHRMVEFGGLGPNS